VEIGLASSPTRGTRPICSAHALVSTWSCVRIASSFPTIRRTLGGWNAELGVPLDHFVIVADDVLGGVFAINGGALGPERGNVYYFAPDTLEWEDLARGHTAFVQWALSADLAEFYGDLRWPGWEAESEEVGGDRAISLYPPPWTAEGRNLPMADRRTVPAAERWHLHMDIAAQLGGQRG
jgi:hypothetical protein